MIGLDTNVLVRYFAQDNPAQSLAASQLLESLTPDLPGYVPSVVLAEIVWVLEESYAATRGRIASVVENLLRTSTLVIQDAESTWAALSRYRTGAADFSDFLIERHCARAGCIKTITFDKRAARDAGMTLVKS